MKPSNPIRSWLYGVLILAAYVASYYVAGAIVYFKLIPQDSFLIKVFEVVYYPLDRLDDWNRKRNAPPPGWKPE